MANLIPRGVDETTGQSKPVTDSDLLITESGNPITGLQGATGILGNTGIQGIQGTQGNTGVSGNTGVQGTSGGNLIVAVGAQGPSSGASSTLNIPGGTLGADGDILEAFFYGNTGSVNSPTGGLTIFGVTGASIASSFDDFEATIRVRRTTATTFSFTSTILQGALQDIVTGTGSFTFSNAGTIVVSITGAPQPENVVIYAGYAKKVD